ncbi:MAG: SLC13 family permease [Crocinitomicaceae bacterium]|nr:SLC13 family permease [Crocinitomicaceae bacterium]
MKNIILAIGLLFFISTITLTGGKDIFWNSIALGGLMIYFWVFEVIPIYITALFPLIFAIPLGVLEKSDLATSYGDSNVYLFFGGFLLALGLEKWNVHQQIAKGILKIVGNSKPRILLGFLFSTGLLSMWISNTATALMMLPMAMAIIEALPAHQRKGKFAIFLLLSVAYAASIGGVGTLIGSPPNVQMASTLESTFGVKVDFLDWMKIGLPLSITMVLCTYLFFYIAMGKERKEEHADLKLSELGWNKDQRIVLFVFLGVIILWSFKDLIVDWTGISYRDENAAILGGILLFLIPSSHEKKKMLEWKDTEKLPWGILLLFGGGLALAQIFEKNGVMAQLSKLFSSMHDYSFVLILIAVIVIAVFASEVLSNLAMVSIFVPLVATFALDHGVPIEKLAIPLTLGASLAFMLPVGTPPNAIVFSSGYLKVKQMVMYGLVLNIIGIILITLFSILFL